MSRIEPSFSSSDHSPSVQADSPLNTFIACAHQMLDPATPERVRRATESTLLEQLPVLRALGVFALFEVRDPAMRAWLTDELEMLDRPPAKKSVTLLKQT